LIRFDPAFAIGIRGPVAHHGQVAHCLTRPMKLFGIATRTPSFAEFTAASLMALGLWLTAIALIWRLDSPPTAFEAGALLLVLAWGCVGVRLGIRPDRGPRHLLANFAVSAVLLGLYAGVWGLVLGLGALT